MNRARNNRGFTLLEILMAFTILMLGVVGVYAVFSVGLVSHKRAVDNTHAANLASSLFDDISANYDVWYYDRNRNGVPDLAEDRNNDGVDDWFEPQAGGRPRYPIPLLPGYSYRIRYVRSDVSDQELFVTVQVFWRQQGEAKAATFQRSLFLKRLPAMEPRPSGS